MKRENFEKAAGVKSGEMMPCVSPLDPDDDMKEVLEMVIGMIILVLTVIVLAMFLLFKYEMVMNIICEMTIGSYGL